MQSGTWKTRLKGNGKLFMASDAFPLAFNDLGNSIKCKPNYKIDHAQQLTAENGFLRVSHEEPGKVEFVDELTFDELTSFTNGLLNKATRGADITQASGVGATFSIAGVALGLSHYVGAVGLANFVVTGKTLGTDYTIDLTSGMLTIVPTGTIGAGSTVAGTFDKLGATYQTFPVMSAPVLRGPAKLILYDINNKVPRQIVTGSAVLSPMNWGEYDPTKNAEFQARLLWVTLPLIQDLQY